MEKKVNRLLTKEECFWLDKNIEKGTIVYEYYGPTYGCISPNGIAVTLVKNNTPFFEIPQDSFDKVND